MPIETITLLSRVTAEDTGSSFSYGEKKKGAGYHKNSDGLHTAFVHLEDFIGTIKIQGTLELYPGPNDWVDIEGALLEIGDSSALSTSTIINFTGKFVFIRAAYNLQNGTITEIRYNY